MKKILFLTALSIALLLLILQGRQATGQQTAEKQLIRLQAAAFDPVLEGEPAALNGLQSLSLAEAGPYYLVQFNGPVQAVWQQQLEQLGAEWHGYIPDNAHILRLEPEVVTKVAGMYAVRWLGPYQPAYKLDPALAHNWPSLADAGLDVEVTLMAFAGEPAAELVSWLVERGGVVQEATSLDSGLYVRATLPAGILPLVAYNPAVSWVEPFVPPVLANDVGRRIMNVENVWQDYGVYGSGQIVGVSDSGLSVQGALNADFTGRLVRAFAPSEMLPDDPACAAKTNWTDLNGHGTHVAGSVLGSGLNSGSNPANRQYANSFAGTAPEAGLVFMALNTDGGPSIQCVSLNSRHLSLAYEEGARISSHSWGAPTQGQYTIIAHLTDNYLWQHKDYLVLRSAGNDGPGLQTMGSVAVSKNVVAVGATENYRPAFGAQADNPHEVVDFSSRGPAADGRIKPDVMAPGTYILSVRGAQASGTFWADHDQQYAYMGGTSMSTPLTAGAAALVRDWLQTLRGMPEPSAAFLKALLIHGAAQLPGLNTPNVHSGWGRVDLKNTFNAQYVIFDDHKQGLTTGNEVEYTVEVVAVDNLGLWVASEPLAAETVPVENLGSLSLVAGTPNPATVQVAADAAHFDVTAVPGHEAPDGQPTIREGRDEQATPATEAALPPPPAVSGTLQVVPAGSNNLAPSNFLQHMVGGGNFEDPDWTNIWSYVWLGMGIPARTDGSDGGLVLNGQYSMWLGGTPSNDSIRYPLSFPETIAADNDSWLQLDFALIDLDPGYDYFCVALVDAGGSVIGQHLGNDQLRGCIDAGVNPGTHYQLTWVFTSAQRNALEGQSGYLVIYTVGDGALPHMSAFVDDVFLILDLADVTLMATPTAGPAGTTFLLQGQNNVPYGPVELCLDSCSNPANVLGTVYADARGDLAAYLNSSASASAGSYAFQTSDYAGRTANTTITITEEEDPSLNVAPASGTAGTRFDFTGSNFLPNDTGIAVAVNGNFLGNTSSDSSGAITFHINTTSTTPEGSYTVTATDSAGRNRGTSFQVTVLSGSDPALTVTPASGPGGSSFVFNGRNFDPSTPVHFILDGQNLGQGNTNASGEFQVTLNTTASATPGQYTLTAVQDSKQASAQFQITGSGTEPDGAGLYVTLVWTDPPAQPNAAVTLVNNLNLRVEGPGGTVYHGNGGNSPDNLNNVETIRLENPAAGTYTIIVTAQSVNTTFGSQPYALVATTAQSFGADSASIGLAANQIYLPLIVR